jgi:L-fucose isomerase
MKGKSYLSLGSVSMGIAGSIVDPAFFEDYLGMRCEYVDMCEFVRRIDEEIYDKKEYTRALDWVKKNCREGKDNNPAKIQRTRQQKDKDWEFVVKMTMIARDLMVGNPELDQYGYGEEALGHNAIAAGFQGQRHWTDHFPNGDFLETMLNSSFDWNGIRESLVMSTENDAQNAVSMLFGHLVSDTAQVFTDVRTFWSPDAVKRVTGYKLEGHASSGIIHLSNSACTETLLGYNRGRSKEMPGKFPVQAGICRIFQGWRFFCQFPDQGNNAGYNDKAKPYKGFGAGAAIGRRLHCPIAG